MKGYVILLVLKRQWIRGLTAILIKSFPGISPATRPLIAVPENIDPYWFAGFSEGEGCYRVVIQKGSTKVGFGVRLRFTISQHSRDEPLIRKIRDYLGCGYLLDNSKFPAVYIDIAKYSDILNIIIPFFNKYTLHGTKRLDFQDFCKVAELMENKAHLTHEGLKQIEEIQRFMNKGRDPVGS